MSTLPVPADRYTAIAKLIARLHNSGLTAANATLIMQDTIGEQGDAQFADLATWKTSQLLDAAKTHGIKLIPARLERVMEAVRFITPTTPLCPDKTCAQFTITNERGHWEIVLPGHSCPVCNEYIEPSVLVTKRTSWVTGREVELSEEFDRQGAEPVPLTQHGILDFVARRGKTIDRHIVTIVNHVLKGMEDPYLRFLNVLACHPKHSSVFPRGPLQVISVLYAPDVFSFIENEIKDIAFLAKEKWWVKGASSQTEVLAPSASRTARIVALYSSKDKQLVDSFYKHFQQLVRKEGIEYFDATAVATQGDQGRLRLEEKVVAADCLIVFLSADYLANPVYPLGAWVPDDGRKIGIGIYMRACLFEGCLDNFGILPSSNKPVSAYSRKDAVWIEIAQEISRRIKDLSLT